MSTIELRLASVARLGVMKISTVLLIGFGALVCHCGGGDAAATGEVWEQVYGSWSCTAEGRPPIRFEIQKVAEAGVEQRWTSDGQQGVASVHTDALYLEDFKDISYDDYGYTEQPKGTLAALDEFGQGNGVEPYHCVRP
jgi:hypothetical protein